MLANTTLSISALAMGLALGAAAQTRAPAPTAPNRSIVTAEAPRAPGAENKNAEDIEFLDRGVAHGLGRGPDGRARGAAAATIPVCARTARSSRLDHAAQAAEIEALLKPLNVAIPAEPSSEAQVHHAALARLSGEEFDTKFVEMMIASHTEAIEKYGAQTHANPDRTLHDFAAKGLPMLREHLAEAAVAALSGAPKKNGGPQARRERLGSKRLLRTACSCR